MGSPGEATFPPTDGDGSFIVLCSGPLAVLPPTNLGSLRFTAIAQLYCAKKNTKNFFALLLHIFNALFKRRNYYELGIPLFKFFYVNARLGYFILYLIQKKNNLNDMDKFHI